MSKKEYLKLQSNLARLFTEERNSNKADTV